MKPKLKIGTKIKGQRFNVGQILWVLKLQDVFKLHWITIVIEQ